MKRQFYFDHVERDLLRCALSFLRAHTEVGTYTPEGVVPACKFTARRIDELLARLQEPAERPAP